VRIVTLAWGSFERPAGTELCHLDLCRGLARRGHELVLLYERGGPLLDRWREFTSKDVQLQGYLRDKRSPVRSSVGLLRAASTAARLEPDCVYLNYPADAWFGRLATLRSGAPVVCHLHLPYVEGAAAFMKFGYRTVSRFVAVSESTARMWRPVLGGRSRISVVHNGVDTERYRPVRSEAERAALREALGLLPGHATILLVGRIAPEKGVDVLLRAVRILSEDSTQPQVDLVIAGEEQDATFMRQLRDEARGLPVTWPPWQPDVVGLYGIADVVAVPSIWPEPFGLVVLEALACERPVVASDVGGLPEVLHGVLPEFLVPPGDPGALAIALAGALRRAHDPAFGRELREYVSKNFSLEQSVSQLEEILVGLVRRRKHR
jgi:glycosyltransferase involved in cell wall biosynthesis